MKDDHVAPRGDLQVLGWTAGRHGDVQVLTAASADAPLSYTFEDALGDLYDVEPQTARRSTSGEVNLMAAADAEPQWVAEAGGAKASFGSNLSDAWTLAGTDTWYLGSITREEPEGFSAAARMLDPLTGDATPVRPLTRYAFGLKAALHRCQAQVTVSVLSEDGRVLDQYVRDVDPRPLGGTQARDYDPLRLEFVTEPGAASVRVTLRKGRTERRDDSYVFFVDPELTVVGDGAPRGATMRVSRDTLRDLRRRRTADVEQAVLAAPEALLRSGAGLAYLWVEGAGARSRIGPIALGRVTDVAVTQLELEGARVRFSATSTVAGPVQIGLYVDGAESRSESFGAVEGAFSGLLELSPEHLDGRPHRLELRRLPEQATLAVLPAVLPNRLTPWTSIQALTRVPADISFAPSAAHHFRAYRAWMAAVAEGRARALPDLTALHAELLQGFRARAEYPPLAFPEHDRPDVTVVIPAHNKFEVTYLCLCGLLFAYNDVRFEVVLVDDGSRDRTAAAETVISGVRIVRHETATGFVQACNDGAAVARGRYVCFLNNDTEVTAGWLDELVRAFEAFDGVGLAGSKLLYPDGKLQEAGGIVWRGGNPWNVGRNGNASDPRYNYLREVDYLSGAAILLPAEVWREVGGFSPEFAPGYFEDTDLAMKVRESGRRVVYVPTSAVIHFEGQSSGVSVAAGMKRFQEVNRPKFKRKWGPALLRHGLEGDRVDREKDRGAVFRVLFVDQRVPQVDNDAGSYAAFQEIRLLQSLGAKVTFLPRNLAWMDQHTLALQRIGVETVYAPFAMDFESYIRANAAEFDLIYVNRYRIGEQILGLVRSAAPQAKVVLNLADLHFLRELREAQAGSPGYTIEGARKTRAAELAVIRGVDLTLSYTDVELAVLQSHLDGGGLTAKLPWVVDVDERPRPAFGATCDVLFLGGFGHPPNIKAVQFFAGEVMPGLRERLPELGFDIIGSNTPPEVTALAGDGVRVLGQVADLQPVFQRSRVFVAPLLAGAGIKGKVLEAMARGSAMVLSPLAAEGTGLVHEVDCMIADTPHDWVEAVSRLYADEALWTRFGEAARSAARTRFGFEAGARAMQEALMKVDIFGAAGLYYKYARPDEYRL
jgi:GT2 family glycosyltransferase/glycosyltransferase involved in cell wall biosynthesis